MDSRRRAYLSPCAARCRSHAGFFTSGSLPVYGPAGALDAVPTVGGAASARHRATDTEPRGAPWPRLPPHPASTGGRSGRASELCIVTGRRNRAGRGRRGAERCVAVEVMCSNFQAERRGEVLAFPFYPLCGRQTSSTISEARGIIGGRY